MAVDPLGAERGLDTLRDGPAMWREELGEQHSDQAGESNKGLMGLKDLNLNHMGNRKLPTGLYEFSLAEVLWTSRRLCSHVGGAWVEWEP